MRISSKKISSIATTFVMTLIISIGLIFSTTQTVQATPHTSMPTLEYANGDTWIGTDGNVMSAQNAKQWKYELNLDKKSIDVNKYTGSFTSDGKINGVVPASINGLPVTNMSYTFYMNERLVIAPVLPATITSLYSTFFGTKSLIEPPVIPYGTREMESTFMFSGLRKAPDIPATVVYMSSTFDGAKSLNKVGVIPESVEVMVFTFNNTPNLKQRPAIPSSVKYPIGVF